MPKGCPVALPNTELVQWKISQNIIVSYSFSTLWFLSIRGITGWESGYYMGSMLKIQRCADTVAGGAVQNDGKLFPCVTQSFISPIIQLQV